jgi:putative transposase
VKFNLEIQRRRSIRLRERDYSAAGKYFLTICTRNRELIFGTIENKSMILSPIGVIAERYWKNIPRHFPNIRLDKYCIMPNHIHGILIIDRKHEIEKPLPVGVQYEIPEDHIEPLPSIVSLQSIKPRFHSFQHIVPKSIGSIIRTYKTAVTKRCNENGFDQFIWQRNFYDRIIRDDSELKRIQEYIRNNPTNWEIDEENPKKNRFKNETDQM